MGDLGIGGRIGGLHYAGHAEAQQGGDDDCLEHLDFLGFGTGEKSGAYNLVRHASRTSFGLY
jgi:hypothetical protein